jgi:hypothetical protein
MKLFRTLSLLSLMAASSSCALMMNDKNDQISINSNPSGANIFIEGRDYGQTPATITIEAKNSTVVLTKEGYGSTQLQLEAWAAVKNGACSADMLGAILVVPLYSVLWSGKCNEFKEKQYFVTIPRTGAANNSMMGVGKRPSDMINYYYNQDSSGAVPNASQQQQYRR